MRRHLCLTISLLLVVGGAAVAGFSTAGASNTTIPHVVVKIASGTACPNSASFCFKPAVKKITKGTRVVWKNATFASHTVTRCTPAACSGVSGGTGTDAGPASGTIAANGGKYSFVFNGTGTYVYYCQIHGYTLMHGTIKVTS